MKQQIPMLQLLYIFQLCVHFMFTILISPYPVFQLAWNGGAPRPAPEILRPSAFFKRPCAPLCPFEKKFKKRSFFLISSPFCWVLYTHTSLRQQIKIVDTCYLIIITFLIRVNYLIRWNLRPCLIPLPWSTKHRS